MPSKAFKRIMRALKEAEAFAQGKETGAIVHYIEVPDVQPDSAEASPKKSGLVILPESPRRA